MLDVTRDDFTRDDESAFTIAASKESSVDRPTSEGLAAAVFFTLLWSVGIGVLAWYSSHSLKAAFMTAAIYSCIHAVVGKISSSLILLLCKAIDLVYRLNQYNRWGDWTGDRAILVAAFWPVLLPLSLVFLTIALIYGGLFRILFPWEEKP